MSPTKTMLSLHFLSSVVPQPKWLREILHSWNIVTGKIVEYSVYKTPDVTYVHSDGLFLWRVQQKLLVHVMA